MIRKDSHHGLALPDGALDLPQGLKIGGIHDWTDYGIWGLLLFDEQPPWFTLVECVHILFHRQKTSVDRLFEPPSTNIHGQLEHEYVEYKVPLNLNLRHLLFRDLKTAQLASANNPQSKERWKDLIKHTEDVSRLNLSYLPHAFEDIESLHRALDLLRSTEVEAYSSKRWTSRHLLPLGPDMLFADVEERKYKGDRHFMRRTGEILYLMLGRSQLAIRDKLTQLLQHRLLTLDTTWNQLARLIRMPKDGSSSTQGASVEFSTGYLPFPYLKVYDHLARDWASLLSLRRMPIEDVMDPLMRLSALHQIIYMLQRAQATVGLRAEHFPPFVFDLASSARKNPVQRIAVGQYGSHVKRPREAIDVYIDDFAKSPHWQDIVGSSMETHYANRTLAKMFLWPKGTKVLDAHGDAAGRLTHFRTSALANTKHSIWAVMANHTRRAGMVLAQRGVGTWYAPNDVFLEALVLANVKEPLEMGEFLRRLFNRYRIVIGQEQAQAAFGREAISLEQLKNNEQRLEERLRILGFIDRKSDACAFVVNPFYDPADEKDTGAA